MYFNLLNKSKKQYIKKRVKLIKYDIEKTLIYGLIAQMVRAHAW